MTQLEFQVFNIGDTVRVRIYDGSNWVGKLIEWTQDYVVLEPIHQLGSRIYRSPSSLFAL